MRKFTILSVMLFGLGCMATYAQSYIIHKTDGTKYEYKTSETSYIEFVEGNTKPKPETGTHEAVDLGLSVKWAKTNIGATKAYEYGDYFAWGETTPKEEYRLDNYLYYGIGEESRDGYTKYVADKEKGRDGYVDNKTVLDKSDDPAYVNWGGTWRTPTKKECEELKEKCQWIRTELGGVGGWQVVGPNGNSIFLPYAGYHSYSSRREMSYCYYWSSTIESYNAGTAYALADYHVLTKTRAYGLPVRPVSE